MKERDLLLLQTLYLFKQLLSLWRRFPAVLMGQCMLKFLCLLIKVIEKGGRMHGQIFFLALDLVVKRHEQSLSRFDFGIVLRSHLGA